ncbi:MAG: hypothetical protein E3J71_04745 [Candidatus Stahlbacteria bacterium]|nr:MAG: hypothetical protein E3J71_04745 [Candidatus Stahlbacteria bacterium]
MIIIEVFMGRMELLYAQFQHIKEDVTNAKTGWEIGVNPRLLLFKPRANPAGWFLKKPFRRGK